MLCMIPASMNFNPTREATNMKTLSVFLHSGMILFLIQPNAVACSLNPTANIVTDPEGIVFYHNEAVYSHTFSLAAGESERDFKVQLRVRNSAGNYGFKTMYVTVTRNSKACII